jgi:hypothetical protein
MLTDTQADGRAAHLDMTLDRWRQIVRYLKAEQNRRDYLGGQEYQTDVLADLLRDANYLGIEDLAANVCELLREKVLAMDPQELAARHDQWLFTAMSPDTQAIAYSLLRPDVKEYIIGQSNIKRRYSIPGIDVHARVAAISRDGRYVALHNGAGNAVSVYDVQNVRFLYEKAMSSEPSVAFSSDGASFYIVAKDSSDIHVRTFETETGTETASWFVRRNSAKACILSADGQCIICTSLDDGVEVYDVQTHRLLWQRTWAGEGAALMGVLPSNGQVIRLFCPRFISLCDPRTGTELRLVLLNDYPVDCTLDGHYGLFNSSDMRNHVLRALDGNRVVREWPRDVQVQTTLLANKVLEVARENCVIKDLESGEELYQFVLNQEYNLPMVCNQDGSFMLRSATGIDFYDMVCLDRIYAQLRQLTVGQALLLNRLYEGALSNDPVWLGIYNGLPEAIREIFNRYVQVPGTNAPGQQAQPVVQPGQEQPARASQLLPESAQSQPQMQEQPARASQPLPEPAQSQPQMRKHPMGLWARLIGGLQWTSKNVTAPVKKCMQRVWCNHYCKKAVIVCAAAATAFAGYKCFRWISQLGRKVKLNN